LTTATMRSSSWAASACGAASSRASASAGQRQAVRGKRKSPFMRLPFETVAGDDFLDESIQAPAERAQASEFQLHHEGQRRIVVIDGRYMLAHQGAQRPAATAIGQADEAFQPLAVEQRVMHPGQSQPAAAKGPDPGELDLFQRRALAIHPGLAVAIGQMNRLPLVRTIAKSQRAAQDRKSTRLNSSHVKISYAVVC